jgi:hypothetical protein
MYVKNQSPRTLATTADFWRETFGFVVVVVAVAAAAAVVADEIDVVVR